MGCVQYSDPGHMPRRSNPAPLSHILHYTLYRPQGYTKDLQPASTLVRDQQALALTVTLTTLQSPAWGARSAACDSVRPSSAAALSGAMLVYARVISSALCARTCAALHRALASASCRDSDMAGIVKRPSGWVLSWKHRITLVMLASSTTSVKAGAFTAVC